MTTAILINITNTYTAQSKCQSFWENIVAAFQRYLKRTCIRQHPLLLDIGSPACMCFCLQQYVFLQHIYTDLCEKKKKKNII